MLWLITNKWLILKFYIYKVVDCKSLRLIIFFYIIKKSLLCSLMLHLFDFFWQKYSKNTGIKLWNIYHNWKIFQQLNFQQLSQQSSVSHDLSEISNLIIINHSFKNPTDLMLKKHFLLLWNVNVKNTCTCWCTAQYFMETVNSICFFQDS